MYCLNYEYHPVKFNKYREIFLTKFNLGFHHPHKDRCDKCEDKRMNIHLMPTISENFKNMNNARSRQKPRDADKGVHGRTHAIISFDLQNVLCLPHENIKSMFYLRKLAVYNLTTHCSIGREGYCAIWVENVAGRTGNDIASALVEILNKVVEHHQELTDITLWSDACVAQNRNPVITLALMKFMSANPSIQRITQKIGTPGHSSVQEVDNLHNQIEKKLRNSGYLVQLVSSGYC